MASKGIASAELKLIRAAKHIRTIKRSIAVYAASKPHKLIKKSHSKKQLNIPKSPPIEIAISAGEAIYQMRSALDYLAFSLIERNPNISTIDPEWKEHCEFPLWTKPLRPGQRAPLPKDRFARCLPGIADAPFTFIESIQPYYRQGAINNALRFLAHLSNIDKHRRLHLTRPRVRQHESIRYPSGLTGRGHSSLDRGAEIYPVPPLPPLLALNIAESEKPVYVKRHYTTFVAFDEWDNLGEATTLPVDELLELILNEITTHIVPAFKKFIKKT
jgi:hypothetical protein